MFYYTYMLKSINTSKTKTYVGYTNNLISRLKKHNLNKGAKSTRGYKWSIIFSKKFNSRNEAMSFEYKLKKNKILRKKILNQSMK